RRPVWRVPSASGSGRCPVAGHARSRRSSWADDHDTADSAHMLLSQMGYPGRVAYDAHTALALARSYAPQVALIDLAMPGGNGLELPRQLRELPQTKNALLICISGFGREKDRRESRAAGFDHHLLKPINWTELLQLVEQRTGPA